MSTNKVALVVLDGWGIGAGDATDAVRMARTPFMDGLVRDHPHATLLTDGEHVGLPAGQMGNSEVGHMNIGAGRIVFQDLVRIDRAIRDGSLARERALVDALEAARRPGVALHLMGLLSDGGVHAMRHHAEALCRIAVQAGVPKVFVHAFTDGRDADPRSGKGYMQRFLAAMEGLPVQVASVVGRYYAMDRDKRWERVARAHGLLVRGEGIHVPDPLAPFDRSYSAGVTDEFVEPHVIRGEDGAPVATIRPGDVVICFNYRTDRCREITRMLTQSAFPEQGTTPLQLHYVTMTEYDPTFREVDVIFRKDDLAMTLGEAVANAGLQQIRIAETEKYPHVSFFFSGGREAPFAGEQRIMVPSPKVATYDQRPEMSAQGIVDAIVPELRKAEADLVVLNFANPDMVGHTGVFDAVVKAVETTDACLAQVVRAGMEQGYRFVIIADHGNADQALNPDGSPNTAHSTNPVPVVVVAPGISVIRDGVLADVAPTVLDLMNVKKPAEMTGSSLLVR
jgi:2,3-bisphosphoglycerate-independent phosphoglycerate mutase